MPTKEDEAAWQVAEAAGVGFICDGMIWYRKEKEVDAQLARAIITQAKSDEIYEGPVPEEDEKAISEAQSLVQMAEAAWAQYVRGPEVEAILKTAAGENGSEPAAEPAEPEATPETDPAPEPDPPAASPETQQESSESMTPEEMSKVEPWEGYSEEKVGDIIEAIDIGLEEDENPRELLAHIWAFESAHKDRKRVLKRLDDAAQQLEGGGDEKTPQAEEPKAEASGESGEASGEGQEPDNASTAQGDGQGDPEPGNGEGEPGKAEAEAEGEDHGDHGEDRASGDEPAATRPDAGAEPAGEAGESGEEGNHAPAASAPEGDADYEDLIADVDAELANQRLHTPPPLPEGDQPELPFDLTTLSDKELQQFHGYFQGYVYRSNYLLMREEARARRSKDRAEELVRELLVAAEKYDAHDKAKTMTILEAEVEQDAEVIKWRRHQRKHDVFAQSYRSERDSYLRVVEALSRQESMRQNEWERGGGRSGKR